MLVTYVRIYLLDGKQKDLESNTALWFALWCIFLLLMVIHITTCIWFSLACTGVHDDVVCLCDSYSWAAHMDSVYGRTA